jgi:hypothetical protein
MSDEQDTRLKLSGPFACERAAHGRREKAMVEVQDTELRGQHGGAALFNPMGSGSLA